MFFPPGGYVPPLWGTHGLQNKTQATGNASHHAHAYVPGFQISTVPFDGPFFAVSQRNSWFRPSMTTDVLDAQGCPFLSYVVLQGKVQRLLVSNRSRRTGVDCPMFAFGFRSKNCTRGAGMPTTIRVEQCFGLSLIPYTLLYSPSSILGLFFVPVFLVRCFAASLPNGRL